MIKSHKTSLLLRILEKFTSKPTTHNLELEPSNIETNPEYYDVYEVSEEELNALDEEEGEDLWF